MPIEQNGFYSLLGIAMRAGVLTFGQDGVLGSVSSGSALCVLLDSGASDNTKKKIMDSCRYHRVPVYETAPDRLGFAVGKPGRMSAAVADGTLGQRLMALAQQEQKDA